MFLVMSPSDLLTTTQASLVIGVSTRTVIRRAESGVLPIAQRLPGPNGHFLFRRDAVEAHRDEVSQRRAAKGGRRSSEHVVAVSA